MEEARSEYINNHINTAIIKCGNSHDIHNSMGVGPFLDRGSQSEVSERAETSVHFRRPQLASLLAAKAINVWHSLYLTAKCVPSAPTN